jgi:hypothetical protein
MNKLLVYADSIAGVALGIHLSDIDVFFKVIASISVVYVNYRIIKKQNQKP